MLAARLNSQWPVLRQYDQDHLGCIAMPLGGIGTGTVSLGGRGQLRHWEIYDQPAKASRAANAGMRDFGASSLFVLRARPVDGEPVLRALEGVLQPPYEGEFGATAGFHGVPRFRSCRFAAAYPFAQVCLEDAAVPLRVRLEAFNPLIPGDADASGLPLAVLRYVLANPGDVAVEASVCASLANLCGGAARRGEFRAGGGLQGLFMTSEGEDEGLREWGSMALATSSPDVSYRCAWQRESWRRSLLHVWDDLAADGRLDGEADGEATSTGELASSLAASLVVPPGEERVVTFLLTWHFPNRYNWSPREREGEDGRIRLDPADRIGNYYTCRYEDAWHAAAAAAEELPELEERSLTFVREFCGCDLPVEVKEAALFNVSTLRTQTCFRTPDGILYGWEGCCDERGCCSGSCTHVWNYETTTAFLFADLAKSMRTVEFLHATDAESGGMSFRVQLPLEREQGQGKAAADGQMGCIMKVYREWQLSGDTAWLQKLWPRIRLALEFCWRPGGWDADEDGVMEGCQHNTMDVEYYGPNPQMQGWYLGALRAAVEMATALGDTEFAGHCRELFEQGRRWTDENLFNGEYYEHRIRPPANPEAIHPRLRLTMGTDSPSEPDLQLGPGCLVDQLVGQGMAHVCGLGYLLDPEHVRRTLESIMRYNYRDSLYDHFNHMRTFALNDEAALLMASYPRGGRPESPFPYFSEVMTGFEYCAATHMLYEDLAEAGLRVIRSIRARYDGRRRNPFDEAECGHHYARAMAAWSAIPALTGFHYSAVTASMTFAAKPGKWFWSTGHAWGTCEVRDTDAGGMEVRLHILHGTLCLRCFRLRGQGEKIWDPAKPFESGTVESFCCAE